MTICRCFLLFGALLSLSHCKTEVTPEDQLPPATQTGQNTAGCRVDGIAWTAQVGVLFGPKRIFVSWDNAFTTKRHLILSFTKVTADESHMHSQTSLDFFVPNLRSAGTFVLDQPANPRFTSANPAYGSFTFAKPSPEQVLLTGPTATGRLVVTRFDSVSRVVAGTFEFTAREASGAASVQVSEGRFDCRF